MTEQGKSWRDVIKVHPAADLFPMMTPDELKALGEDIKKNGIRNPIVVWVTENECELLIDGRNRLDAAELVGLLAINESGQLCLRTSDGLREIRKQRHRVSKGLLYDVDPYTLAISLNIHRRHLTAEQKRDVIAAVLRAQPEKSNRTIAKQTKVDHKTVGAVRDKLEAGGEIPHVSTVEDTKGRSQPARKPIKKTSEDEPAQAEGAIPIYGSCAGGRVVTERSNTAQKRLEAAIRQARRKLELEFDQRLQQRLQEALNDTVLPAYNEYYAIYRDICDTRKGLMTKATYNKIASCLHPDSRNSVTREKLVEVFQIWRGLEIKLLDETQSTTPKFEFPRTYEEAMALKQKVSAARKAKREVKREANEVREAAAAEAKA